MSAGVLSYCTYLSRPHSADPVQCICEVENALFISIRADPTPKMRYDGLLRLLSFRKRLYQLFARPLMQLDPSKKPK